MQGALGDCWFLAALSAVAEFPALVKRLFVTQDYSDSGVYEIECCFGGRRQRVCVDDYFPCDPASGKPCYSQARAQSALVKERHAQFRVASLWQADNPFV